MAPDNQQHMDGLEKFVAELRDAAYRIALAQGLRRPFIADQARKPAKQEASSWVA